MAHIEADNKERPQYEREIDREQHESEQIPISAQQRALERQDILMIQKELLAPSKEEQDSAHMLETIAEKERGLEQARSRYIEQYHTYVQMDSDQNHNLEEKAEQQWQLEIHKAAYTDAKKNLAEILTSAKVMDIKKTECSEEQKLAYTQAFIQSDIFQKFVLEEDALLAQKKAACHSPEKQSFFRKMYDQWNSVGSVKKVLISTALTTGLAFMSIGLGKEGFAGLEMTGVALFYTKNFLANLGKSIVSDVAGRGIHQYLRNKIQHDFETNIEHLRKGASVQALDILSDKYTDLIRQLNQKNTFATLAAAASVIASGKGYDIGLGLLSQSSVVTGYQAATTTKTTISMSQSPDLVDVGENIETAVKPIKNGYHDYPVYSAKDRAMTNNTIQLF